MKVGWLQKTNVLMCTQLVIKWDAPMALICSTVDSPQFPRDCTLNP